MKKRILSLLLVAIISCSICACGENTKENTNKNSVLIERNGVACIKGDKFGELLERVELTTENWKDFIKVHSYNKEIVHKDSFGEITSSEKVTYYCIGANSDKYYKFEGAVMELKNKETGELTVYDFDYYTEGIDTKRFVTEEFNLDNYECTRIKGYLYFVDIPMEALHSPLPALGYDWGYNTGFYLISNGTIPYEVNANTKEIYKRNDSWNEYFE